MGRAGCVFALTRGREDVRKRVKSGARTLDGVCDEGVDHQLQVGIVMTCSLKNFQKEAASLIPWAGLYWSQYNH